MFLLGSMLVFKGVSWEDETPQQVVISFPRAQMDVLFWKEMSLLLTLWFPWLSYQFWPDSVRDVFWMFISVT